MAANAEDLMLRLKLAKAKARAQLELNRRRDLLRRSGEGAETRAERATLAQRARLGTTPPQLGASLTGPVTGFQGPSGPSAPQIPPIAPEDAPAFGATLATLPFLPVSGPAALTAAAGRQAFVQSLPRAVGTLVSKAAPLAKTTVAAAAGGAAGGALVPGEKSSVDAAIDGAIEQGIANPVAHLTLGLGKFLLAPAGQVLQAKTRRLIDFVRKEGLQADPAALLSQDRVAKTFVPSIVSEFTRKFLGARLGGSLKKMRAIAEHMSSDPEAAGAFFQRIAGRVDPIELRRSHDIARGALMRIAGPSRSEVLKRAERAALDDPARGIQLLFESPAAVNTARRLMTRDEFKALSQANLQNMFRRATPEGSEFLNGEILGREIRENRDVFEKIYAPDVLDRLENFAVFLKAHARVPDAAKENLILDAGTLGATGIIGGTGMLLDPTTVPGITVAVGAAIASQLFNPRSVVSKWLTTGLLPKSAPGQLGLEFAASLPTRTVVGEGVRAVDEFTGGELGIAR